MISRRAVDVFVIAALMLFGLLLGSFVFTHFSGRPRFYQEEFGPAVMVASGRGFVNPALAPGSPLADFLSVRRPVLQPAEVPAATVALDQFQQAHRYLLLAAGVCWKISGISWAALSRVTALLCALTLAAAYLILRPWMPWPVAAGGVLFFAVSPLHLEQLPHIRDYAKAPFLLLAIALTPLVALRPFSWRQLAALAATCGVAVGIGLGFKMDVAIMIPIFALSVLLFTGQQPGDRIRDKVVTLAAFAVAVAVTAAPVLLHLSRGGSNGYHAILLGESDPFDANIGVTRPDYSVLPFYDDGYVASIVKEYGTRLTGSAPAIPSPAYDAAGRSYWFRIMREFPADVATRALGAAVAIFNSPFDNPAMSFVTQTPSDSPLTHPLTNQLPHRLRIAALFEWLAWIDGSGALFGVVLIAAAAAYGVRAGLFALWMIAALSGYASFQFADRHAFHLEIVAILAVLVAASALVRSRAMTLAQWRRVIVWTAAVMIGTAGAVTSLRVYQQRRVTALFESYVNAASVPLALSFVDTGQGTLRTQWSGADSPPYYMAEFEGTPGDLAPLEVRYRGGTSTSDYSRVITMSEKAGVNRVLFAGYTTDEGATFDGIEIPAALKGRLRGVYHVTPADRLAPLLDVTLAANWKDHRLYQWLSMGRRSGGDRLHVYGSDAASSASLIAWLVRADSPKTAPSRVVMATRYEPAVTVSPDGIEMDATSESQSSYLFDLASAEVAAPSVLVARGMLERGGIAIGVLENGRWHHQVTIGDPGPFVAVVGIDHSGTFVPIVTSATRRDHNRLRFHLSRMGVVGLAD